LERNDADPKKGIEAARTLLSAEDLPETEENIFIVAACGDKGLAYLKGEGEVGVRKVDKTAPQAAPAEGPACYTATIGGQQFQLSIDRDSVTVNGKTYQVELQESTGAPVTANSGQGQPIKAELPGKVIRILTSPGSVVAEGDPLLVLEAMKMEMQIASPAAGTVQTVDVSEGEQVAAGVTLVTIG
jgi:pyruvate carboxylase subunit B